MIASKILMQQFESDCYMHYCVYACYTYTHRVLIGLQHALAKLVEMQEEIKGLL